ncbi:MULTISPECIES: hypothetical protein [unclassified Nocardia]|uniref:hypothetical protein n=1 Tax=unclassified Nocardia TaxID=2637762 RepID=UPI001CE3DEFB|nr:MULTISPECIES: hypothetical protein [unclassified Nocardia]
MRKITIAVTAAATVLAGVAGCAPDPARDDPAPPRGDIVSSTPVAQLDTEETGAFLAQAKFGTPVRNGVDAFRVDYRTITPDGKPTTASGLVVLPRTETPRLRLVGFEHGTMFNRGDAPSVDQGAHPDKARTIMFAAAGYAAVAPDYLGLGDGPGFHPYTHAPSEVSASADLLRAARTLAAQRHREIEPDVLVTGFSQGGEAATGLGKALQAGQVPGFGLAALAPVSGPYDVQHVETPAGLDGRVTPAVATIYFAYWITSMNRIHHLYDQPAQAFQQPYADTVEQLFDGAHTDVQIATGLPSRPDQLLTPEFLARAKDPTGSVLAAMRDSDGTCDWTPRVPVRLYAATGDHDVPYQNSESSLRALNSDKASLTDLGEVDHNTGARLAMPRILDWFQQVVPAT